MFSVFIADFEKADEFVIRVEETIILGFTEMIPTIILTISFLTLSRSSDRSLESISTSSSIKSLKRPINVKSDDPRNDISMLSEQFRKSTDINRTHIKRKKKKLVS